MINVNKSHISVAGPAPEILAEITLLISAVANSMKRDGIKTEDIRALFRSVADRGVDLLDTSTTIDLSYHKGE